MKSILDYIDNKKHEFAQLPFFDYLRDSSIDPLQRLSFIPCASPFIMSFRDLNKHVFCDANSTDELQLIINQHARQDEHHWIWFLEDLEKLGLNPVLDFRETLKTLWNDETVCARQLVHEIYRTTYQRSPIEKLVVIESIETTGSTFFGIVSEFVQTLEHSKQEQCRYFGAYHLEADPGHTYCTEATLQYIENIELTGAMHSQQLAVVDLIFDAFARFTDGMLAYAQKHPARAPLVQQRPRIGTCLIDAGLITLEQLDAALTEQKTRPQRLGEILASHGWVKQQTVEYLIRQFAGSERKLTSMNEPSLVLMN
ncbi:MAG: hypothetical protein WA902_19245 [Thermosynechococcaceae cyanobacterium]